eukprot:TRINITY_DN1421_c0_g1_i3.p1 TRINITY_DN1421_c0_g1~~TRINITY_DN1421_c0_g1_i3.p1  ORF type:complete len:1019 (-),score=345.35 TRINITY_DN1421_c0_g1_i3:2279-5335(-)
MNFFRSFYSFHSSLVSTFFLFFIFSSVMSDRKRVVHGRSGSYSKKLSKGTSSTPHKSQAEVERTRTDALSAAGQPTAPSSTATGSVYSGTGGGGGGGGGGGSEVYSPQTFLDEYKERCRVCRVRPVGEILRQLDVSGKDSSGLSLSLDECRLSSTDLSAFVHSFPSCRTVSTISFKGNEIGDQGAEEIARLIRAAPPTLTSLHLEGCAIGEQGGIFLAAALATNPHLLFLNLNTNKIGNESADAIADAIRKNTHLQTLLLSRNRITDAGGARIAESLRENGSLQRLSLLGNAVGFRTGQTIIEMLQTNRVLIMVDVSHTSIRPTHIERIESAIQANLKRRLVVSGGAESMGQEGMHAVASPPVSSSSPQQQQHHTSTTESTRHVHHAHEDSFMPFPPPSTSGPMDERESTRESMGASSVSHDVPSIQHADLVRKCRDIIEKSTSEMSDTEKVGQLVSLFHLAVQRMNAYGSTIGVIEEKLDQSRSSVQVLSERLRHVTHERDRIEAAYRARLEEAENASRISADLRLERDQMEEMLSRSQQRVGALEKELVEARDLVGIDRDASSSRETARKEREQVERELAETSRLLEHSNSEMKRIHELYDTAMEEVKELQSRVTALTTENEGLKARVRSSQLQTKGEKEKSIEEVKRLERVHEQLRNRIAELTNNFERKQREYERSAEASRVEIERLQSELRRVSEDLVVSARVGKESLAREESLSAEIDDLQKEILRLTETLERERSSREHSARIGEDVRKLEQALKEKERDFERVSFELQECEVRMGMKEEEFAELNGLLENAMKELDASTKALMEAEEGREKESITFKKSIDDLERELKEVHTELSEWRSKGTRHRQDAEVKGRFAEQMKKEHLQLERECEEKTFRLLTLEKELQSKTETITHLRATLEEMNDTVMQHAEVNAQSEFRQQTQAGQLDACYEKLRVIEAELNDSNDRLAETDELLRKKEGEAAKLRRSKEDLEAEIRSKTERIRHLEVQLNAKSSELDECIQLLAELERKSEE